MSMMRLRNSDALARICSAVERGTVALSGYAVIRKATLQDLEAIKQIADANKEAIGFVLRPALAQNIEQGWVLVAEKGGVVIGFANYRHRRDEQTTLYEICVAEEHRGNGVGRALLEALMKECRDLGKGYLRLKCPVGSEANAFYASLAFEQLGRERGKNKELILWERAL